MGVHVQNNRKKASHEHCSPERALRLTPLRPDRLHAAADTRRRSPLAGGTSSDTDSSAKDAATVKAGAAKEQATQVAGDAKDAASNVAGAAKEQAGQVASEVTSQAKDLYGLATSQLKD